MSKIKLKDSSDDLILKKGEKELRLFDTLSKLKNNN